jgi:hypothetical protein
VAWPSPAARPVRREEAAGKRLSTVNGDSMVLLQLKGGKRHVTCDQNQGRSGRGVSSLRGGNGSGGGSDPVAPDSGADKWQWG